LTIISNSSFLWYPFSNLLAPNVETQPAAFTATTATLYGRLYDFGASSSALVWFKYKKENDENWQETEKETRTQTGDFYVTITGLTPETTYQFRACASHLNGTNENCDKPLEFTTKSRPPFDFTLQSPTPDSGITVPGSAVDPSPTFSVTKDDPEMLDENVSFTYALNPTPNQGGINVTFSPSLCTSYPCQVTVTITPTQNISPLGNYTITFIGNNLTDPKHSKNYTLTVGGRCEGSNICVRDGDCNQGGRSGFRCPQGRVGTCNTGKNNECSNGITIYCANDNECSNYRAPGPCLCDNGRCADTCLNRNQSCNSDNDCRGCNQTSRCSEVIPGECVPVPPVCTKDEDCPYPMYCNLE